MDDIKILKDRWLNQDVFIERSKRIREALKSGNKIQHLNTVLDYQDLRGFNINENSDKEKIIKKIVRIKQNSFKKVDFSYAELSNSSWYNCTFEDCRFEKSLFYNVSFKNCIFLNLGFVDCKFKHCDLALNDLNKSGRFEDVSFNNCNFKYVNFCFPVIHKSVFSFCKIEKVNFDGSRLSDSTFIGDIEAADFCGYSQLATTKIFGLFNAFDSKSIVNKMHNVDFSKANLNYVGFNYGIDLSTCKFPSNPDRYVIVKNPTSFYLKVRDIINEEWDSTNKKYGIQVLELLFLNGERKTGMEYDFISKVEHAGSPTGFDEKFFNLIKHVSDQ